MSSVLSASNATQFLPTIFVGGAGPKERAPVEDTEWIHLTMSNSYVRCLSGHILTIYCDGDNVWSAHVVGERGNRAHQRCDALYKAQAWCEDQAATDHEART